MTNKPLILFDLGCVLLHLNFRRFYENCAKIAGISPEAFKERYKGSRIEEITSSDATIPKEIHFGLFRNVVYLNASPDELPNEKLTEIIYSAFDGPITENVKLKNRLAQNGYPVGLFSNCSALYFKLISQKYPEIFKHFQKELTILSCEVGAVKPFPQMYLKVPKKYQEVIFVDDKPSYVRFGVENLGWEGIVERRFVDEEDPLRFDENNNSGLLLTSSEKNLETALKELGVKLE